MDSFDYIMARIRIGIGNAVIVFILRPMKKPVFLFLGVFVLGVLALDAQTNATAPIPPAPASSSSTSLTPPPDTAPNATTSPTPVSAPVPQNIPSNPSVSAPATVAPPAVTSHTDNTPAPVKPGVHGAPSARAVAMAKPRRPHLYHLTRVSYIVATRDNLDVDDRYVTIVGHVTRRIGDDEYWFSDGTGSVRLDSENFDLPIGRRIIVGGRIDQAWFGIGHLEVDVRRWRYAY